MALRPLDPLVSVVMPFKDAAAYLEQAAASVLAQTWSAVELVLVDDGGTDGSLAVAERVRDARPERVRLVSHPGRANRGIGASRRAGFAAARGQLVANLDADDVWEPGHLEHQVRLLQRSPGASVVVGRAWSWRSWRDPGARDVLSLLAFAPGTVVPGERLLSAVLRHGAYATPTCSLLVRADLLGAWTSDLEAFSGMYEDQVLNSAAQLRGTVVMSGATSAWYRLHPSSISATGLGADPATRYDTGRAGFLDWLGGQELLGDELRALVREERLALEGRTGVAAPAPARSGGAVRLGRAVERGRQVAGRVVRRTAPSRHRRADAPPPSDEQVARALSRYAEDLRGPVLLVGGDVAGRAAVPELRCEVPLSARGVRTGPHHWLAGVPGGRHACAVVVERSVDADWSAADLRHLRRALAPGGVLLLLLPGLTDATSSAVREAFGVDAVSTRTGAPAGDGRAPLAVVRAAVPTGPGA